MLGIILKNKAVSTQQVEYVPAIVAGHTGPDGMVSDENAKSGGDEGDHDSVEHAIEVAGDHVDQNVAPSKRHRHYHVEQNEKDENHRVVLILDEHQSQLDVVSQEVAGGQQETPNEHNAQPV